MKIGERSMIGRYDGLGMTASTLCIAHCVLTPLAIGLLPAVGLSFLAGEEMHRFLVLAMMGIAALSFGLGYPIHRRKHVLGLMAAGLGLLAWAVFSDGRLSEAWETGLTIVGGMVMVSAHWLNRGFCRSCVVYRVEKSCCDG
ncbi:MAG: hypothetical protein B7X93_05350 [Hydrogenophilales bacterium 17-61-9]|nr:MAG: hypothetical protein B7X93_05350 [Hydrogenophilales bacterium 17-61-9]